MEIKSIPFFFLFLFTLVGFLIDSLSYSAIAATLSTTKFETFAKTNPKNSFSKPLLKPGADVKTIYTQTNFVEPTAFIMPVQKVQRNLTKENTPSHNSPLISNSLNNIGENFLIENEDNIFLQDSLIVLGNTKQFLKETDLMLHDLSENIIVSLKLDSLVTNNNYLIQQTALLDTQLEPNTIKYETLSISEIYKNIINWNNLFYLIAAIICYSILRAIINFLLLQQKNKQISRSSRY